MNKILTGMASLVAVTALVSTSAYALFSAQATVSGVSVHAGSAGLTIGNGGNGQRTASLNLGGSQPLLVYPGVTQTFPAENDPLNLYNDSQGNFGLTVKAQITDWQYNGNGGVLADNLYIRVKSVADNTWSEWYTLRQWHDTGFNLPGTPIPSGSYPNNKRGYVVQYSVHSDVGNELSGAELNNMVMTFTGTQVTQ